MEKNSVSKAALGRLPRYLQFLKEADSEYISSTAIAKRLSFGEVQVRKDLSAVCGGGRPKIGYETKELVKSIEKTLGCNNATGAVIVGAGKLGRAILNYEGFKEYGIEIKGAFDVKADGKNILPMSRFESFCREKNIRLGIITVNEQSAQSVCNKMAQCGIKAIWNFAPNKLLVPEGVLLKQENLALSLAYLNNQLCNQYKEDKKQ